MSIESGQKFPQSRRLKKADGTVAYVWDGKLHNWEGPALIQKEIKEKLNIIFMEFKNKRRLE